MIALQKPVRPVTGEEPAGSPLFLRRCRICQEDFKSDKLLSILSEYFFISAIKLSEALPIYLIVKEDATFQNKRLHPGKSRSRQGGLYAEALCSTRRIFDNRR